MFSTSRMATSDIEIGYYPSRQDAVAMGYQLAQDNDNNNDNDNDNNTSNDRSSNGSADDDGDEGERRARTPLWHPDPDNGDGWNDEHDNSNDSYPSNKCHEFCGSMVNNSLFQKAMFGCIIFNSLCMAVGTFAMVRDNPGISRVFEVMDTTILCIFTGELALHLFYYGIATFLRDSWLVFDLVVVSLSWMFQAVAVLRAFRILRAVRLITKMKAMKDLVNALLQVIPRMFAIFVLLCLIYFVFAVLFTGLFHSAYEDGITSQDHFSTLDKTAFTLLQFMFLDDWSNITKELMTEYSWAWFPILIFIVICTFIVVNLIIAVICDAVQAIQTDEMSVHLHQMQMLTQTAISETQRAHLQHVKRLEDKLDEMHQLLLRQFKQD